MNSLLLVLGLSFDGMAPVIVDVFEFINGNTFGFLAQSFCIACYAQTWACYNPMDFKACFFRMECLLPYKCS